MSKKIVSFLLAAILLFSCSSISALASDDAERQEDPPPAKLTYIGMTSVDLWISKGGTATCTASVEGYKTVTKIVIEMTLQKRFLLIFWTDEITWTQTFYTTQGTLQKTTPVTSGTYRTKAVFTANSGNASETVTGYSSNVTY